MTKDVNQLIKIESLTKEDFDDVRRIYVLGIETKNATFETNCPEWPIWNKKYRTDCRLVAKSGKQVIGWAALSNVSERCVYNGVCEVSIYIDPISQGKGVGKQLMQKLIDESEQSNIWTLQAGIFPENVISIELHKKFGFREVGTREKIGKMEDQWRDVLFMERRSKNIGIN